MPSNCDVIIMPEMLNNITEIDRVVSDAPQRPS